MAAYLDCGLVAVNQCIDDGAVEVDVVCDGQRFLTNSHLQNHGQYQSIKHIKKTTL